MHNTVSTLKIEMDVKLIFMKVSRLRFYAYRVFTLGTNDDDDGGEESDMRACLFAK